MATMIYKEGMRGLEMIKRIQRVAGCYDDGIYGKLTTEAVKAWQTDHSLKADGIVGPATLAAMGLTSAIQAVTPAKPTSQLDAVFGANHITLKRSKRTIDEIIVHCTADPEGRDKTVEQIRADHVAPVSKGGRGWSDIGYHYVVYLDGTVHIGRNVDTSGAHCPNHNPHSIGVVYVGGVENRPGVPYKQLKPKDTRTDAQKAALLSLLLDLRKLYPNARIRGHRDFANRSCPSFDATTEYRKI